MTYYHLPTSTARNPGRLEAKLSDGYQIGPPPGGWTPELAAVCGFVPIVTVDRPADTATHTSDRTVALVDGTPTEVWTVRAKTVDELAAQTAGTNRATIGARLGAHITALRKVKDGTTTLTAAQRDQLLAAALLDTMRVLHNRLDAAD